MPQRIVHRLKNYLIHYLLLFSKIEGETLDIHEYQAKEILAEYGVRIADGGLAYSPEEAIQRAREINSDKWVVKAQIHSGARGKAGGIIICKTHDEVEMAAEELLGKRFSYPAIWSNWKNLF